MLRVPNFNFYSHRCRNEYANTILPFLDPIWTFLFLSRELSCKKFIQRIPTLHISITKEGEEDLLCILVISQALKIQARAEPIL